MSRCTWVNFRSAMTVFQRYDPKPGYGDLAITISDSLKKVQKLEIVNRFKPLLAFNRPYKPYQVKLAC